MHEDRLEREAMAVRWPIAIAFVFLALAYAVLPDRVRAGPPWLLLLLLLPLIAATALSRRRGHRDLSLWLGRGMTALVTLSLAVSVAFLLTRLSGSKTSGPSLLSAAASLWATNIGVFALWYWEVDAGGPARRRHGNYHSTDFVFPQFQQDPEGAESYWLPDFLDYLFLAFNTSTAFSPTDTLVLSRRAKALMMTQSSISLILLAVLAARAVNVL